MILRRVYERSCDCGTGVTPVANLRRCTHPLDRPTDRWEPWCASGARVASLYTGMRGVRQGLNAATQFYEPGAPYYKKSRDRSRARVVYFDVEDLTDMTEDMQVQLEQAEAKMLRAAELADGIQRKMRDDGGDVE